MRQENRIRDAFDCIEASQELKASTKDFLRDARQREGRRAVGRRRSRPAFRLALGTACAMAALFLCIGSYAMLWMPVAYVSIDVNPSLELELNRLDRVISGKAYNEDGQRILEGVPVKGMYYEDAIERLVASESMQPYLTQDGGLTFTVATDSAPREEQMLADIARSSGCVEHGGISARADMSLVEEAHENGLSLGKYLAYQVLLQYEPTVTVEDCHEMTMSQIHGRIEEHEHGENHGNGSSHGTEHGGGHDAAPDDEYEIQNESSQPTERPTQPAQPSTAQPTQQPTEQPAQQNPGHHRENGHGHKSGHDR